VKKQILSFLVLGSLACFFQCGLVFAQVLPQARGSLSQQLDPQTSSKLEELIAQLDTTDALTNQIVKLCDSDAGKLAIYSSTNSLSRNAISQARNEAVPRFFAKHFEKTSAGGGLKLRSQSVQEFEIRVNRSKLMDDQLKSTSEAMKDIADKLDASDEASAKFQNCLQDSEAAAAFLLSETDGGNPLPKLISRSFGGVFLPRTEGYELIATRMSSMRQMTESLQRSAEISKHLKTELPKFASEFATNDADHKQLVAYLKKPLVADIVGIRKGFRSSASAVETIAEFREDLKFGAVETANGLTIENKGTLENIQGLFKTTDHISRLLPRVKMELELVARTIKGNDEAVQSLRKLLTSQTAAVHAASRIRPENLDPVLKLRALSEETLSKEADNLKVKPAFARKLNQKINTLQSVSQKIRGAVGEVDAALGKVEDKALLKRLGSSARYLLLFDAGRQAESFRPDRFVLLKEHLFEKAANGKLVVRQDRLDEVQKMVEATKR